MWYKVNWGGGIYKEDGIREKDGEWIKEILLSACKI